MYRIMYKDFRVKYKELETPEGQFRSLGHHFVIGSVSQWVILGEEGGRL